MRIAELMHNAFSVDVEDGISIAMRDRFGKQVRQTRRVLTSTYEILELLARHNTLATFFVLGQVAMVYPKLVRDIRAAGHEVGVHGQDHHVFEKLSAGEAWEELYRAKSVLEDLTGEKVRGHRAPAFSINARTAWVLDLLLDLGFEYDSSVMPCRGVSYGWPGQSPDIGLLQTPRGRSIIEAPLSVTSIAGRTVPALGGSYFRLLPLSVARRIFRQIQAQRPVIVYLHPYELDTEPYPDFYLRELAKAPLKTRLRMRSFWLRRASLMRRYDQLLSEFRFAPIASLLPSTTDLGS